MPIKLKRVYDAPDPSDGRRILVDRIWPRGECGTCQTRVLEGEPIHRDVSLTEQQHNDDKLMCTCVSWARTERLILEA